MAKRYPHEPYRLLLGVLRERLTEADGEIRGAAELLSGQEAGRCLSASTVAGTFDSIRESLAAGRGAMLTGGDLAAVENQFAVFGLHTSRLDLRQHSSLHEAAVAEVLGNAGYPSLSEAEKRTLLLGAIAAQPLGAIDLERLSPAARHVLDPLTLAARATATLGPESLGIYIISMTDGVSDILEVALLQKWASASLPDRPAF